MHGRSRDTSGSFAAGPRTRGRWRHRGRRRSARRSPGPGTPCGRRTEAEVHEVEAVGKCRGVAGARWRDRRPRPASGRMRACASTASISVRLRPRAPRRDPLVDLEDGDVLPRHVLRVEQLEHAAGRGRRRGRAKTRPARRRMSERDPRSRSPARRKTACRVLEHLDGQRGHVPTLPFDEKRASRLLDRTSADELGHRHSLGGRRVPLAVRGRQMEVDMVVRRDGDVSPWEFLCGVADRREIAFHGTGDPTSSGSSLGSRSTSRRSVTRRQSSRQATRSGRCSMRSWTAIATRSRSTTAASS